jgi:hypothetical protein
VTAFLPGPGVVAFYSYATGVSLELPVGFEFDAEDSSSVTYLDADRDDARVQVRVVGAIDSPDPKAAAAALADAFTKVGNEVLARRDTVADQLPAFTVLTRRPDRWLLHQTVLAADGRLLTIVGMVPPGQPDLPGELDTAIDSIRVIVL